MYQTRSKAKEEVLQYMKAAPSLHRKEEFAEAEATADRMTILASRHFVVVVQERKELDKVITNNILIIQYIYR